MTAHSSGDRHSQAAELLAAYALGALEPGEQRLVDAHLGEDDCADCEEEVAAFHDVAAALPLGAPLLEASAGLRERLLGQLDARQPRPAAIGRPAWWLRRQPIAAAVAVLAIGALIGWNLVLQDRVGDLEQQSEQLSSSVGQTESALAVAQERATTLENNFSTALIPLVTADEESARLTGTGNAPDARGRLFWGPEGEGHFVLLTAGLDPTPPGSAYVLWAITQDGAREIAHFYVDHERVGMVSGYLPASLEDLNGMVVSLERYSEEQPAPPRTNPGQRLLILER